MGRNKKDEEEGKKYDFEMTYSLTAYHILHDVICNKALIPKRISLLMYCVNLTLIQLQNYTQKMS